MAAAKATAARSPPAFESKKVAKQPQPAPAPAEPPGRHARAQDEPFPTDPRQSTSRRRLELHASPAIARRLIRARKYVHPDYVRSYEFLNYYSFHTRRRRGAECALP
jgi:hypothetical protein